MQTNWRDFGIGAASGVAFCFVLYFGLGLIRPHRPEPANTVAITTTNATVGMDENALIAANAEHPNNTLVAPPPQLRPEPRNEVRPVVEPEPRPEPPVARPRPERDPDQDLPPPEDLGPDDDDGGKPDN